MAELGWGGGGGRPAKETCPHCGKGFRGLSAHTKAKHGHLKRKRRMESDGDESFASRAVQAEIDRACGTPNDDIDWLLP